MEIIIGDFTSWQLNYLACALLRFLDTEDVANNRFRVVLCEVIYTHVKKPHCADDSKGCQLVVEVHSLLLLKPSSQWSNGLTEVPYLLE